MLASTRNERRGPQNFMPLDTCLSFPPSTGTPPIGCVRFMPTHSRSWLRHVFEVVVRVARSPYKPHSRWLASLFLRPFLDNPFLLIRLCTLLLCKNTNSCRFLRLRTLCRKTQGVRVPSLRSILKIRKETAPPHIPLVLMLCPRQSQHR
jgi:hypothetical protein